jgi:voltage-gated potassium channel
MSTSLKRKIYLLLDPVEGKSKYNRIVNAAIICLIVLNTLAVIFETIDSFYFKYSKIFQSFEIFSIVAFSVEYLLRLWTITERKEFAGPFRGRLRYMLTPGALVDFFAVAPFYIPAAIFFDLRFLRIFRLIRFVRFFKLARYLQASKRILSVFKNKKEELVLSLVLSVFLIIFSASMMYFIEHDTQPDKFSSIPETMWWSVSTLTTVGYKDIYPVTIAGKILSSFISIVGIGMFALPAGILASGFSEEFKIGKKKKFCPECGVGLDH